jgi:hypothetical protein
MSYICEKLRNMTMDLKKIGTDANVLLIIMLEHSFVSYVRTQ